MSERKWVLNASPLILLGNVGYISLLETLCTEMVIPAAASQPRMNSRPETANAFKTRFGY